MPTAQQPPVDPYLLVAILKLAGTYSYRSLWIAVGMNAFSPALTAIVLLKIGKRTSGPSTGVLAAWIWSCWIYEAVVSIRLWESSLSALPLAVALLLLPDMAASTRPWLWLLFGRTCRCGCSHQHDLAVRLSILLAVAIDQLASSWAVV
jgi:hypothetical protein